MANKFKVGDKVIISSTLIIYANGAEATIIDHNESSQQWVYRCKGEASIASFGEFDNWFKVDDLKLILPEHILKWQKSLNLK